MKMHLFPLTLQRCCTPKSLIFGSFSQRVIGSETKRCQAFEKNEDGALTPGNTYKT